MYNSSFTSPHFVNTTNHQEGGGLRRRKGSESESDNFGTTTRSFENFEKQRGAGHHPPPPPAAATMARSSACSRDRTQEFFSAVGSLENSYVTQRQPLIADSAGGKTSRHGQLSRRSAEFMTIARSIGKDIANTYTKLEKLTLLAKRKTIFDDRPQEIQELTFIIKEDMNALNRQIGQLQQIARSQQAEGAAAGRGKHQATHSGSVVVTLQSRLATMTSEFKNVLQVRTENLKESRTRQQQFSQDPMSMSMPSSAMANSPYPGGGAMGGGGGMSLLERTAMEDDESARADSTAISMDGLMGGGGQAQAYARQDQVTEKYLESRADTMQSIESTIVELGGIFQQLAHMIKEQEEVMVRIDSNVEDTAMNVEMGHAEILKYFRSVTSNRWLMVKIFGVLIFFFVFFVMFMA